MKMHMQALSDKLSEFLMVEQGGLELYRVAASRTADPELRQRYEQFGEETARHRELLIGLIEKVGGDPSYISPTARLAQIKTSKLLESGMIANGLSADELELNDLENVLLAETKDHADWHLLEQLMASTDDEGLRQALSAVVAEVEAQEDEHLGWAREEVSRRALRMMETGPAPDPARWQQVWSAPVPPIEEMHPEPITDGLLKPSRLPQWQDPPAVREGRTQ